MKKVVVVLISLSIIFSLLTVGFIFIAKDPIPITGSVLFGTVNLIVSTGGPTVVIHSPLNTTYNFAIGSNYTLDLNVSSPSENVSAWWFTLEDLFHNTVVNSSQLFTPNISFNAVRRSNKLTVYANDTANEVGSQSVIFYISVPNSAPLLGNISSQLYACESTSFSYEFNATDADEETLQISVSPTAPFFVFPTSFSGEIFVESTLFTGILSKSSVGDHFRTLSVTDGQYSDSKNTTITVVPVNNAPIMENIGVQTLYTQGEDSTFNTQFDVEDIEDGDSNSGNLSFNISFNDGVELFDISEFGVVNFSANSSYVGVHNITVCATDLGLQSLHANSSLCGETGINKTTCQNFTLTVTEDNRAPTILSYYPEDLDFNATGTVDILFNISTYDPDFTIPDAYWYVDGNLIQYNSGQSVVQFIYAFPCGVGGEKTVSAEITDGLLNDSVEWNITVSAVSCISPPQTAAGGGGGGGGGAFCIPQWGCNDWQVCQNTQTSLELGIISGDDYRLVSESCAIQNFDSTSCGYQTRNCFDNMFCNTTRQQPDLLQACLFTENPGCFDGIKNCHSGSCELLIDCGGPCGTCASCSDNMQNQGELGIDCGGPCPFQCPVEVPFLKISIWRTILLWLFWLLLLILLVILIRKIIKLIQIHKELQSERKIQSALSK